jgi:hypothetical protein
MQDRTSDETAHVGRGAAGNGGLPGRLLIWPRPAGPRVRGQRPSVIKPHEDLNLVFGLTRTTARNSYSGGPVITYSTGGTAYTVSEKTTLEVAKSC